MIGAERLKLGKVVRLRGAVAKADAKARGAKQLAVVEQQLAANYPEDHPSGATMIAESKAAIKAVNDKLSRDCEDLGIPVAFRSNWKAYWSSQGENSLMERRTELRAGAQRVVEATIKSACVEVDRAVAGLQTQVIQGLVQSADGRTFLDALPSIAAMLPTPTLEAIERIAPDPVAWQLLAA